MQNLVVVVIVVIIIIIIAGPKQVALLLQRGRAMLLCPSVVSINSVIPRAQSFIIVT